MLSAPILQLFFDADESNYPLISISYWWRRGESKDRSFAPGLCLQALREHYGNTSYQIRGKWDVLYIADCPISSVNSMKDYFQ
jgi:hypothetical protein